MGFTSELEELRGDMFKRIAALSRPDDVPPPATEDSAQAVEPILYEPDKQLSQDFAEALGFIKSSIAKMDRLISAILHLTREGRREFHPVSIAMRDLIENIASTVAHQAAEADAHIRVEPLPDIVSDHLAIEQIFSNLIDNAVKYSGPDVNVTVETAKVDDKYTCVRVKDQGPGIAKGELKQIFKRFYRVSGPLATRVKGTGLGLYIVRFVAKRHGGRAWAESEGPGRGSTFILQLPTSK